MPKPKLIESRDRYLLFESVTTRWMDNDVYGHVNNTVYNAWMDTAVTQFFRQLCGEFSQAIEVPVAGETQMTFHQSIAHPASVETGFRVERIGTSSVRCGVAIFLAESKEASAWGHMVHVWVDKQSNRSVAIPASVREGLESALVAAEN
jgi:acyl-CoA thioester hydrolase